MIQKTILQKASGIGLSLLASEVRYALSQVRWKSYVSLMELPMTQHIFSLLLANRPKMISTININSAPLSSSFR